MPTRLLDWLARTVMLVLAGLVTLSILGSIAAISNDVGRSTVLDRALPERAQPEEAAAEVTSAPTPTDRLDIASRPHGDAGPTSEIERQGSTADGEQESRWLEAIAYALLGVAGLLALALILLGFGLRQLRRIADALDARRP
jgi:hypothetical protein